MHTAHLIGGLKAYIFLMLSDDHEFWSCDIEEMPKLDELKLIKEADMLVSDETARVLHIRQEQLPILRAVRLCRNI